MKYQRITQRRETPLVMSQWSGDCHSLKIYNRLAELEDKIESGELCDRKETAEEILKPLYNVIMEHPDCCVNLSEDIKFLMEKYGIDLEDEERPSRICNC